MPSFIENYQRSHTHPVNRFLHSIGIPTIVISLPLFFWNWKIALAMFIFGWILQFVGHMFEGKPPAFFKNPIYLLVGPIWAVKKLFRKMQTTHEPSPHSGNQRQQ